MSVFFGWRPATIAGDQDENVSKTSPELSLIDLINALNDLVPFVQFKKRE